jgi:tRNA(Ile)-lysidine synthase
VVTVERDLLYFGNAKITKDFLFEIQKGSQIIKTPAGEVKFEVLLKEDLQNLNNKAKQDLIDYDKVSDIVFLRNRRDGDKYCPKNRNITKSLKKLFNDEKTPISKRSQMLILSDESEIIWTEYFGVSEKYKITNQTEKYIQIKNVGE